MGKLNPNPGNLIFIFIRHLQIFITHLTQDLSTSTISTTSLSFNSVVHLPEITQDPLAAMAKTGYAMILARISQAARPAPSRKENRLRLLRLHEFIARGVLPNKFPINSRKTWRGSFDPTGQDPGLSADNPTIRSLHDFVDRLKDKVQPQLFLQLRIMVLEAQIYLEMRKAYEVVVNEKFVPQIKDKYRKWVSILDVSLHQES